MSSLGDPFLDPKFLIEPTGADHEYPTKRDRRIIELATNIWMGRHNPRFGPWLARQKIVSSRGNSLLWRTRKKIAESSCANASDCVESQSSETTSPIAET